MRSGKQTAASAATSAATSKEAAASASSYNATNTDQKPIPKRSLESGQRKHAHHSSTGSAAEESDVARILEMWWDQLLLYFVRHRATAAFVAWLGVFLFDIMDLRMPAEWLVFTFFSFSVFVHAFGVSILLFAALTVSMTILNVAVFYVLPLSATSLFSTIVVCMLLVRGVHGLDARGWAITALMSLTRMHSPWCEILPDYLQAPIAAYCTSFGILWLAYQNSKRLERLLDPMCLLLGIIPPLPPRLSIVEISDTSVTISWSQLPGHSSLAMPELDSLSSAGISLLHGGSIDGALPKQGSFSGSSASAGAGSTLTAIASTHQPTHGHEQPFIQPSTTTSPGSGHLGASTVTTLNIGGFLTIDRKSLPEACVSWYEIEVDGHVVGDCKPEDGHARVQGLNPASMYQIRVWAISASRGRAPSPPIFVSTHAVKDDGAKSEGNATGKHESVDNSPIDIANLREEIDASQRTIKDLEDNISSLKARAEQERTRLHNEISELRARRKEEESARSEQREKIRELEAEKRQLDKGKLQLEKDIAAARARKQKALDRIQEQEKQAATYKRNAKSLEAIMERERRDHDQMQTELKSTINTLKSEVEKTKSRLDDLSTQHSELSTKLKSKRAELKAQEKRNASLDAKVKDAEIKRQQKVDAQKEMKAHMGELQKEIDMLIPKLKEATAERQKLEMKVSNHRPPLPPPPAPPLRSNSSSMEMARPSAAFLPSYRLGGANIAGVAGNSSSSVLGYPNALISSRWMPVSNSPLAVDGGIFGDFSGRRSVDAVSSSGSRHIRSSSFASNAHNSQTNGSLASYKPASQHAATQANFESMAVGSAASRHSAEFSDMYSLWGRRSPMLSATAAVSSGLTSSIGFRSTSAFDVGVVPSSSSIGGITSDFGRHMAVPSSGHLGPASHLSHVPFWRDEIVSPTTQSTNTAEASALSILKDTDLAYPTPERPGRKAYDRYNTSILQNDLNQSRQSPDVSHAMFANGMPALHGHNALGQMFSESADSLNQGTALHLAEDNSRHLRLNSLDIRARDNMSDMDAAFGKTTSTAAAHGSLSGRESGRNSVVTEQCISPCGDLTSSELGTISLHSTTPAEQQQQPLRLSGDFHGQYRPMATHSSAGEQRPHVEPIGAPNRRRGVGAPTSPKMPPATFSPLNPPRVSREISHPSSFGESLYHKRSFWDISSNERQTTKDNGKK
ncbi:hypothetical protein IW140_002871 [Coemansia sp. RSA 1813]|nr:hypothetical protein IW140_002871 [Coemansia sp. RSA 1813]